MTKRSYGEVSEIDVKKNWQTERQRQTRDRETKIDQRQRDKERLETERQRKTRDRETKIDQRQRDKDRLETERETIRLLKNLSVRSFDEDYVLCNCIIFYLSRCYNFLIVQNKSYANNNLSEKCVQHKKTKTNIEIIQLIMLRNNWRRQKSKKQKNSPLQIITQYSVAAKCDHG